VAVFTFETRREYIPMFAKAGLDGSIRPPWMVEVQVLQEQKSAMLPTVSKANTATGY
jgi:hypothetical protein